MFNPIIIRTDRSANCKFIEYEMIDKYRTNQISEEEFNKWWDSNCGQCIYMCEICMHGEVELDKYIAEELLKNDHGPVESNL